MAPQSISPAQQYAPSFQPSHSPQPTRRRSVEVDRLRARALQDDPLTDVGESIREWVWRSLLKGVRLRQACRLAGIAWTESEVVEKAIARVRKRYEQRLRRRRLSHPDHAKHREE